MADTSRQRQQDQQRHGAAAAEQGGLPAEAIRRTGEAGAEAVRQAGEAAAEARRPLAEDAAAQLEAIGRSLAEAVRDTAEDVRRLVALPAAAAAEGGGMREMQRAVAGLAEGVLRTNLRAAQELLRLADPGALIGMQRRFAREYLDALVEGQAGLLRATRRAADETLRPIEERLRQGGGQDGQRRGRVADVMTREVRVAGPEDTVQQAARLMRDEDTGVLPVGEGDRLVGMVTDRDVALRLVAEGKDPARTRVREVMTPEVRYLFEDEDLHRAAETMAGQQVRRLPVVSRDRRLVGVVSLGDLATEGQAPRLAGRALAGVVREGGPHDRAAAE